MWDWILEKFWDDWHWILHKYYSSRKVLCWNVKIQKGFWYWSKVCFESWNRFQEKYLEFGSSIQFLNAKVFLPLTSTATNLLARVSWLGKCECPWPPPKNLCTTDSIRRIKRNPEQLILYHLLSHFNISSNPYGFKSSHHQENIFVKSLVFNFLLAKLFERALKCEPINVISHFQQNVKSTKEGIWEENWLPGLPAPTMSSAKG